MPIIQIKITSGKTKEQKHLLVSELTRATTKVLNCPPNVVDVIIEEVNKDNWAKDGKLFSDKI